MFFEDRSRPAVKRHACVTTSKRWFKSERPAPHRALGLQHPLLPARWLPCHVDLHARQGLLGAGRLVGTVGSTEPELALLATGVAA